MFYLKKLTKKLSGMENLDAKQLEKFQFKQEHISNLVILTVLKLLIISLDVFIKVKYLLFIFEQSHQIGYLWWMACARATFD